MPAYVEDELHGYLQCGLLCFGFARAVCMTRGTGFVVAFSCEGRGVCPARPITAADLAALGVGLVFSQENAPDPNGTKVGR